MRIAIDARMIGRPLTGVRRYSKELIRNLSLIDTKNEYLILYNNKYSEERLSANNFRYILANSPPLSWRTVFYLHKTLEKEKVDLFHSPFFLAPWLIKCPLIITVHDLMALTFPNFFAGRNGFIQLYAEWFVKITLRHSLVKATKLIADSNSTKGDIIKYLGLRGEKIEVIHCGVGSYFQKLQKEIDLQQFRRELKLDKRVILYIGNTRPYKNIPRLLRAFQLFINKIGGEDYSLVIVGGEKRNLSSLKKLAEDLNIKQNVMFFDELTDEKVVSLLNLAEIFVFPSLYEGFGLPPLEAMACGTPVITSNRASLPEVVGDAALLVNPENIEEIASAMLRLLTDGNLKHQLIEKGFERVKRFSWEETAKQTLEVYKEVYEMNKGSIQLR